MATPFDVLFIGLGAVGGLYAYILQNSNLCSVTALVRSLHSSISSSGITIRSEKFGLLPAWKPHRLLRTPDQAADRSYRFIVCAFKSLPDVQPTHSILAPFLVPYGDHSSPCYPTVVLIQNGIGIEQPLAEAFPSVHIISCVAWIGAHLIHPLPGSSQGPVIEHGALEKLVFGLYEGEGFAPVCGREPEDPALRSCSHFVQGILAKDHTPLLGEARQARIRRGKQEVQVLASALRQGGGEAEVLDHIQPARWAKNLWNGALSTMCSLTRAPVSALTATEVLPYTLPVVRRAMLEILYVARALGYTESDLPAQSIDDAIQLTICHYQVKQSKRCPSTHSPGFPLEAKVSSDAFKNEDVFEEEEEEEEEKNKRPGAEPVVKAAGVGAKFKPSMLIDLENGRPMELEPIVGAVLDRARSKAIETPRLDLIYSALKVAQERAVRCQAANSNTEQDTNYLHCWAMRKPSIGGSGTSDSRQAWLDEVQRRSMLGQKHRDGSGGGAHGVPLDRALSSASPKVTGKPLVMYTSEADKH